MHSPVAFQQKAAAMRHPAPLIARLIVPVAAWPTVAFSAPAAREVVFGLGIHHPEHRIGVSAAFDMRDRTLTVFA